MRERSILYKGRGLSDHVRWLSFGTVLLLAPIQAAETANSTPPKFTPNQIEFYQQKVQPILADNCFKCHSHQAEKIKGSLVIDSREGLLQGGDTGPAAQPGEPDASLLIKAVRRLDENLQMPPKKTLAEEQIALLAEWIKMGAPYPETGVLAPNLAKGRRATTQDRGWWSFQPVRKVSVPEVKDGGWSRNPIDNFIFAKLSAAGLAPAREADKRTLIRRAYFDLIGLPPEPEEVARFVSDNSPMAYEKVIEGLLHNPHYGEKWARHWLDLVRYAESDGFKLDAFRANAWRYRDYVIGSFNQDKPFNRFLMEQIAADELWPKDPEALIGVSYLRLPIYEYNQRNVKGQWATILNDITDVTADAFLGLGLQCARCHDHKFDPILQRDYFRLQACFAPLSPRDDLPLATSEQVKEYQAKLEKWQSMTAGIREQIEAIEKPVREKSAKAVIDKFPRDIQVIMRKPSAERTPYEQQINDLAYRQVQDDLDKLDGKFKGSEKQKLDGLMKKLAAFDEFKPKPLPDAMLVTDIGTVAPPLTIPKDKSQTPIEPGLLALLNAPPLKPEPEPLAPNSTGRRAALAKWLAQPDNRFTTRVIVNRVWQRHFGRGIVGTLNDFGHLGELPSHPELLDWLTTYFVEHSWSLKELHRLILTSATYRQTATARLVISSDDTGARSEATHQSSRDANLNEGSLVDPENRSLWRQNLRRLESDQVRDSMLWASGELDLKTGGPSVDASKPRRTIYTKWLRNSRDPLLDAFDPPDSYTSTPQRNVTTTPMQSLVLLNGPYALQRAQALASRLKNLKLADPSDTVTVAYQLVYDRQPSTSEKSSGTRFLQEQAARIAHSEAATLVSTDAMPGHSGAAALFKPGTGQTRLQVPDNHLMPQYDFTIEAFILLRSVGEGDELRTIVSRWDGRKDQPGWALGVTGKKSDRPPQTLVLELIGDPAEDGAGGYEAISSGLRLELDTPYFVGVSVRIGDTSETGVTFFTKEMIAGAPLRTARVPHRVTANHQSNLPLVIGGRDPEKHQIWDGLIDDVRLSSKALQESELLLGRETARESTVGYWRFEEPDFFKDSSPNGHNIKSEISPSAHSDPATAALIDFCHALLNSSEFLYAD
jgi:hypothetical protein